ncbi:hypothetical protein A3K82_02080 [Candidatus Pacearchaeota archaeon RBG_19FT_COMBO_34_9]|nr:MAG: hypothetical protein A3K82_02080 [Candidatus Pacearchaeota archaeon RBG_19FT_COMBO_34_9]
MEEFCYINSEFIPIAIDNLQLKDEGLKCEICDTKLTPEEVGGFIHGSIHVICKNPNCKIVARIKELTSK